MTSADFGDSSPSSYLTVLKLYTGSRKVGEGWMCVFLSITDPSSFLFCLIWLQIPLPPPPPSHQRVNLSLTYLSVLSVLNIWSKWALKNNNRLKTHVRIYSVRKFEKIARNVVVTSSFSDFQQQQSSCSFVQLHFVPIAHALVVCRNTSLI